MCVIERRIILKKITKIEARKIAAFRKKKRVAAYVRVSTLKEEQKESLLTQKTYYENLINNNKDWQFAGIYIDEGISGRKASNRLGINRLISDAKIGKVDIVLTKSISRFARNTVDCMNMVRELANIGVYIRFEKENIDTERMESELILSILSSIAENESLSTSENVKWAVRKQFENGTYIISDPPFGYENKRGEMVIVPENAELVRYIFEQYLNGKGGRVIAKLLNKAQILSPRGKRWTESTIFRILRNIHYTGAVLWQKTYINEKFEKKTNKGEKDMFYMENHHEAIISKEEFNKVQHMMKMNETYNKNINRQKKYVFSGKIKCGLCGAKMYRTSQIYSGKKVASYRCVEHYKDKEFCSQSPVFDEDIKIAFCNMINKLITYRVEILDTLLDSIKENNLDLNECEAKKINLKIDELNKQLQNVNSLYKKGILDFSIFNREELMIKNELSYLKDEQDRNLMNADIRKYMDHLIDLIKGLKSRSLLKEFDEKLAREIIKEILVIDKNCFDFYLYAGLRLREEI